MAFLLERDRPQNPLKRFPVALPLGVFVLLLLLVSLLSQEARSPQIGLLNIEGMILDSRPTLKQIRYLENQEEVRAVLVRIDSPGGAVAPSQEIFSALMRLRQKKPVYISMGSVAASGGYYIALAGQQIFANAGSLTGSIGVIMQTLNAKELLDKWGLSMEVIKSGANKDAGSLFRPMNPAERKLLESVIMDSHDQFVGAVAERRGLTKERLETLADGRIFTGRQAQKLGLVDQVGGFEEALSALKKQAGLSGQEVKLSEAPNPEEDFFGGWKLKETRQMIQSLAQGGLLYLKP